MNLEVALDQAAHSWRHALGQTPPDLSLPSCNEGWTIQDLINHVHGGAFRYRYYVTGHTSRDPIVIASRKHQYLSPTPAAAFDSGQRALVNAIKGADLTQIIEHPATEMSIESLAVMRIFETALHSWDLTQSLPADVEAQWVVSNELAHFMVKRLWVLESLGEQLSSYYKPATGSPVFSAREELLAATGRASLKKDDNEPNSADRAAFPQPRRP